jgi:hypothetical protein
MVPIDVQRPPGPWRGAGPRVAELLCTSGEPHRRHARTDGVLGVAILLVVLAVPYLIVNVRRLRGGKRWAYTFCALGRDWEERMRAQTRERRTQADLRAADPPAPG